MFLAGCLRRNVPTCVLQGVTLKIPVLEKRYLDLYALHKVKNCIFSLRFLCSGLLTVMGLNTVTITFVMSSVLSYLEYSVL